MDNMDLQQQGNLGQDNSQSDLNTETGQESGGFINQEAVQKAINRQHRKYQEEKKLRLETEARLQKLEEQMAASAQQTAPTIPPVPDPLDSDYQRKMEERDKAIQAKAVHDQKVAAKRAEQSQSQQRQAQQSQQSMQTVITDYQKRAATLGVDAQELVKAESSIAGFLNQGVANYLLRHEQGPLIVKHLADNILELDHLSQLSDIDAAVHITQKILPALKGSGKKRNSPDDILDDGADSGGPGNRGQQPQRSRDFMRGVTME